MWYMTPCSLVSVSGRFRRICCPHHQDTYITSAHFNKTGNLHIPQQQHSSVPQYFAGFQAFAAVLSPFFWNLASHHCVIIAKYRVTRRHIQKNTDLTTVHTPGDDPCQECDKSACARFHPRCTPSLHGTLDVFSPCVVL